MFYVAEEIPIFYSFFGDKLCEFKLFYWQRSVLNVPKYQSQKFEFGVVNEEIKEIAKDCLNEYKKIPSLEIWTEQTIFTATRQLEYYYDSGIFKDKKDAVLILDDINKMVDYLEECAQRARKELCDGEDTFQLYWSEVILGTNCIYVNCEDTRVAYISFNTLNSLKTNNSAFCEETDHWVRNIIKKSTLISGVAEKQRFQFFNEARKIIQQTRDKILSS